MIPDPSSLVKGLIPRTNIVKYRHYNVNVPFVKKIVITFVYVQNGGHERKYVAPLCANIFPYPDGRKKVTHVQTVFCWSSKKMVFSKYKRVCACFLLTRPQIPHSRQGTPERKAQVLKSWHSQVPPDGWRDYINFKESRVRKTLECNSRGKTNYCWRTDAHRQWDDSLPTTLLTFREELLNFSMYYSVMLGRTFWGSGYCQVICYTDKMKRLQWAQKHIRDSFDSVIWTDKCTVQMESHRRFVCQKCGEVPWPKPRWG